MRITPQFGALHQANTGEASDIGNVGHTRSSLLKDLTA
jgi:hypothetical protein